MSYLTPFPQALSTFPMVSVPCSGEAQLFDVPVFLPSVPVAVASINEAFFNSSNGFLDIPTNDPIPASYWVCGLVFWRGLWRFCSG